MPMVTVAVILACALFSAVQHPDPSFAAAGPADVALSPSPAMAVEPPLDPLSPPADRAPDIAVAPSVLASASTAGAGAPLGPTAKRAPPSSGPARAENVSISLAERADFVAQYTGYWCVGASLQMARAIITGDRDETRRTQRRYWRAARARSPNSPYDGANPVGWAATLNDLGLGPYRLVSEPTFDAAVRTAAQALAETGKPVGLVVWAGHHAWLMTGFESRGDPRVDGAATVTGVRVMDPLYPHKSKWGRAPAPDTLIELDALARQFVRRHRPDYDLGVPSGWLLIIPVD